MYNNRRRYEDKPKLNYKKISAVLIGIAVVIMIIISIIKIIQNNDDKQQPETMNYFTVYLNNKWGVIDNKGNIVVDTKYEEMVMIPNREKPVFICVYDVNDETGTYKTKVVNEKQEEIVTGYDRCEVIDNYDARGNTWYEDNVLRVSKNGKYGLADFEGNRILSCEYDEIVALKGVKSNFLVRKGSKVGLVNEKGQTIIPIQYKEILTLKGDYNREYIIVNEMDQYGLISTSGTVIFEPKYELIKYVNSSEAYVVKEGGTLKLVNTNESAIVEGEYDDIVYVKGENIIVVKNGKYGIINRNKEEQVAFEYDELKYAFATYYIAKKDGKYGVIDIKGQEVVGFEYSGMFCVEMGSFIQADISEIETAILDSNLSPAVIGIIAEVNTDKGYIRAYVGNEYKYYNFKLEEKKSSDILTENTIFLSKGSNGKYGYVNKNGDIVIGHRYDDATEQNKYGYAAVKMNGVWGSIDKAGKEVLSPSVNLDNNIFIDFIGEWHLDSTGLFYTK